MMMVTVDSENAADVDGDHLSWTQACCLSRSSCCTTRERVVSRERKMPVWKVFAYKSLGAAVPDCNCCAADVLGYVKAN